MTTTRTRNDREDQGAGGDVFRWLDVVVWVSVGVIAVIGIEMLIGRYVRDRLAGQASRYLRAMSDAKPDAS